MEKDQEAVSSSYIFVFYKEVQALTDVYADYLNLLLEFENKYPSEEAMAEANPQEKGVISQWVQLVRKCCHKTYIQYKAIEGYLKLPENIELDKYYTEISNNYIIKKEKLRKFVQLMHKILMDNVIQDMLSKGAEFMKDIYSNDK